MSQSPSNMGLQSVLGSTAIPLPSVPSNLSPYTKLALLAGLVLLVRPILFPSYKNPPPGPPAWPIIGNIIDILAAAKSRRLHLLFEEWANKYGDVMLIRSGVEDEYYVNTRRAAKAIMDTNTATTSQRPRWIVSNEHMCGQMNLLYLSATHPRWKVSIVSLRKPLRRSSPAPRHALS